MRVFKIFVTFEKQRGVCKLAYKSCYKEIHVPLQILMLLSVFSTRFFLQILIITRTNGEIWAILPEWVFSTQATAWQILAFDLKSEEKFTDFSFQTVYSRKFQISAETNLPQALTCLLAQYN